MTIVIGVDGGASKTHALVLDEAGTVLGFGAAGCGNHQLRGLKAAVGEVEKAVTGALSVLMVPLFRSISLLSVWQAPTWKRIMPCCGRPWRG